MVGTGTCCRKWHIIQGGQFVERAHYVDTIVLDKTGTITGQPVVTDYVGDNDTLQLLQVLKILQNILLLMPLLLMLKIKVFYLIMTLLNQFRDMALKLRFINNKSLWAIEN